jgi:hypothetical protein
MSKKIKLLVCMLFIFGLANAQGSKEDFKNAVDYCACKIAYAYTNQYAKQKPNSDEKKSFEEAIKPEIENCEISNPISNPELSELLSKNNFATFSNEFIPVINQVQEAFQESLTKKEAINIIVNGFYNNSDFKTIITTYTDIGSLENDLKKELNNSLNSFKVKVIQSTNLKKSTGTEWKSEINRLEKSINDEKPFLPNWLAAPLILGSLLLSFFSLFLLSKYYKRLDRHRDELEKLKSNNFNSINSRNTNNPQFERTTNRNISDINDAIRKLQNDIGNLSPTQNPKAVLISKPIERQEEKKQEILFAPAPDKDGSFNVSVVVSSENQSSSFYKFTLLDSQRAKFQFINSERAIRDAVSSYEMILKPVCTFKNALNQNAKRIRTTKEGIVTKQNDKWILDTKAEITYE